MNARIQEFLGPWWAKTQLVAWAVSIIAALCLHGTVYKVVWNTAFTVLTLCMVPALIEGVRRGRTLRRLIKEDEAMLSLIDDRIAELERLGGLS